jgi:hypothetical protein
LSDADATATTIFLSPGKEPPELRQRYLDDVAAAGRHLTQVSREFASDSDARRAAGVIAAQLPVYTGRIDTARANIRQGFPVGAAYQRAGSNLMRDRIRPAATTIYERAARDLDDTFRSGTSTSEIVFVVVAGVLVLALLIGVQLFVTRRSHRILNTGLAAATVLVLVMLVWTVVRFTSEQDALVRAQRHGSDQMQVLSSARILALRAQSDDNLALVERGTGDAYNVDFDTVSKRLGGRDGRGGLLGDATTISHRTGSEDSIAALSRGFATFLQEHQRVRSLDTQGQYDQAVANSIGAEARAAQTLDSGLSDEIDRARARLDAAAADGRAGFDPLAIGIPLLIVLAGVLVLIGLQRRIGEYR